MKVRFVVLSLVLMPVFGVAFLGLSKRDKPTAIYGAVSDFSLVSSTGEKVGLPDLIGKVWVANFIFTSCSGQCPNLSGKMKSLNERFGNNERFRLASFSVDPQRDTSERLSEYAKRYGSDGNKWLFITGPWAQMNDLLVKGFKVAGPEEGEVGEMITHSFKLVLVDPWGRVRGYYDGTDEKEMKKLVRHTQSLLHERF